MHASGDPDEKQQRTSFPDFVAGDLYIEISRPFGVVERRNISIPCTREANCSFNGWSKSKGALDRRLGGAVRAMDAPRPSAIFASTMARLGVKQEVTERLLNHRSGIISGIAAVYTLHDFLPEMRQAVDSYDRHIQKLLVTGV